MVVEVPTNHRTGLRPLTLAARIVLPNEVLCYAVLSVFPVYILAGWSRPSALIGFFVLLSISLAPVLKAPRSLPEERRGPEPSRLPRSFRSRVSEPMKLVGLTPQEVAWATEILADDGCPEEAHLDEGPKSGLGELRKLQEVVEADDIDALPAAIGAAEAAGVEASELRFAQAVLQQRQEMRRRHASETLQRLVNAHQQGAEADGGADAVPSASVVKLRAAVLLARAYGVDDHDREAAEELLKCREAEARRILPSALAKHGAVKGGTSRRLRFASEAERVFFTA